MSTDLEAEARQTAADLSWAMERARALEAELARIRSETIEECAQVADRQECPAIGHLIRDLTKAEETKP